MSATAWPPGDPWRDVDGVPITMGARVEQATVDAELGALRSRLGRQGTVLRRSATRLVVRFDGDTGLTRIRPHLLRVVRALRQLIKDIHALPDPELRAAMQRAQACGFEFTRPRAGAPWWGERVGTQWREVVYLDPAGPCNAVRCRRGPGGALFAERVYGDAVMVLRAVLDWPI